MNTPSCQRCKVKKVKCDRESPCSNCLKAGVHEECQYLPRNLVSQGMEPNSRSTKLKSIIVDDNASKKWKLYEAARLKEVIESESPFPNKKMKTAEILNDYPTELLPSGGLLDAIHISALRFVDTIPNEFDFQSLLVFGVLAQEYIRHNIPLISEEESEEFISTVQESE